MSGRVVVVGSANLDLVVTVDRHPLPGETLSGSDYVRHPGGKGANQAVAVAKLGARVAFVGAVGRDEFGALLIDSLKGAGVDLTGLATVERPTGVAFIQVDAAGQNSIVVSPGANADVGGASVEQGWAKDCAVLCLQLEIPLDTVLVAARAARAAGAEVLLNLAPARQLGAAELADVTYLLVNEHEAGSLLRIATEAVLTDPEGAARSLTTVVPNVVITLGELGAVWASRESAGEQAQASGTVPAFAVAVVDTTAAGDAFAGALAARLAEPGWSPTDTGGLAAAVRFASAAAALATTRRGAQPSLPAASEVEALLARTGA